MSQSLSLSPVLPMLWIWSLVFLACTSAIWAGWRRPIWTGLRLALIAILAIAAMGPVRIKAQIEYLNDIVLLVLDETNSMQMGERSKIANKAAEQIRTLAGNDPALDLIEVKITDDLDGTRGFDALADGLAQIPPSRLAAVITISDGIFHDQMPKVPTSAPIHGLIIGDPKRGDRSLEIIEAPKFGFVGEDVPFKIRVNDFGQTSGQAVVVLTLAGAPPIRANVKTGVAVVVNMPLSRRGSNLVELRVEPAAHELTLRNNRVAVDVTGVRERLRVLLVSGEPYAGVRAWRNLLKSDPAVDMVHFTILRPPTKRDATALDEMALIAFPTRELFVNKLQSFDLVIFDRYTRRGVLPLLYLENVARYVENGGALMVAAGPPFASQSSLAQTFLAGVLPARPNGKVYNKPIAPRITDAGTRHPVTAPMAKDQENWGRWGRLIGVSRTSGDVVMAANDNEPLLVLDRVGAGRVALLLSDQAWLWSRGFEGGGPQYELYRRLAHWLMKEPDLEEEALSGQVIDGKLHVQLQTLAKQALPVHVENTDGTSTEIAMTQTRPGTFRAVIDIPPNAGLLTLKSGKLLAVAAEGRLNIPELAHLQPSAQIIAPLAKQTGGAVLAIPNTDVSFALRRTRPGDRQKGRNWIGLQQNKFAVQTNITRQALLPNWLYVLIGLLLFMLIWLREGHE